jgi:hypothetical protein
MSSVTIVAQPCMYLGYCYTLIWSDVIVAQQCSTMGPRFPLVCNNVLSWGLPFSWDKRDGWADMDGPIKMFFATLEREEHLEPGKKTVECLFTRAMLVLFSIELNVVLGFMYRWYIWFNFEWRINWMKTALYFEAPYLKFVLLTVSLKLFQKLGSKTGSVQPWLCARALTLSLNHAARLIKPLFLAKHAYCSRICSAK